MKPDGLILAGAGGGGSSGGSSSFRNRPDNLRSTDTYEILLGLKGVRTRLAPGGLKNLFIDDVPVEDGAGNPVFTDFSAVLWDGDPAVLQPVNLRLGQSGGQNAVNVALANAYTDGSPGDWVTAAMTVPGAEFIDLRFIVQQLYKQTKQGVAEQTASIEIQMRPSGASNWINPLSSVSAPTYNANGLDLADGYTGYFPSDMWATSNTWYDPAPGFLQISGKTTSAYVKELRIAVPSTGSYAGKTWEVRCRLVERDYVVSGTDGENEDRRTISWESIAGVSSDPIGGTEAWRGVSYLQVYGKATDQISGLPEVTSICDLGEYAVPPNSVWNPTTRAYTGATWDGVTSQIAWTQCPAWQIKGLIEDSLSGISALAPGSTLNKWDTLEASKWFSELVPDGRGGQHPRYSLNWELDQPMQVHELVNYLAGAVGGFAWDEGEGRWRLKVEKPETPQIIFTKEMIQGEFVYSHTDDDSRFNSFTGVFRNKDNRYEEDRVRVFDQDNIDTVGLRHTTIALVGCDNRQEALRRLNIRLLTSLNETKMVSFVTNRLGVTLEPLSVIAIADGDLNSDTALRSTGRVVSLNGPRTQITVRDTMRLEVGVTYKAKFTIPNPNYNPDTTTQPASADWRKPTITIERNVVNTNGQRGDVVDLYLDSALPASLPEFAPVALEAVGLPALPKQYRVTNIVPSEDGKTATISAIEIYTSKWTLSDAITEDAINNQTVSRVAPPPIEPAGGMFELREFFSEVGKQTVLVVNWERPASRFVDDYRIEYTYNGGPVQDLGRTRDTYYELPNPVQGSYTFKIYMRDRRGVESLPLVGSTTVGENLELIAPTYSLTNHAAIVQADAAGTVVSWAPGAGTFELRFPSGRITEGVTYSVVSTTGGLTMSMNATTGEYVPTAMTSDNGTALLQAVYGDQTFQLTYSLAKARPGSNGTPGLNSATVTLYQRSASTPSVPSATVTYTFATGAVSGVNNGWSSTPPAGSNPLYSTQALATGTGATDTIATGEWSTPVLLVQNGTSGTPGTNAVTAILQPEVLQVPSYADGTVQSYGGIATTMVLMVGTTDVSSSFTLTIQSNVQGLTTSISGRTVTVTGAGSASGQFGNTSVTNANLTIRATGSGTYAGVVIDKVFTLAKLKGGYEIVAALPTSGNFEGRVVFLSTDGKLYRYHNGAWTTAVPGSDVTNIPATSFAQTIEPVSLFTGTLPSVKSTAYIYNTATGAMYKWDTNLGAYVSMLDTTSALAAAKITGQLTDAQIAAISAAKLTGQITSTQITDNSVTTQKLAAASVTSAQIAADTITAGNIAANAITGSELAAGSVTTAKLVAGAVTSNELAAASVIAGKVAAGAISATEIAARGITTDRLSIGTFSGNLAKNPRAEDGTACWRAAVATGSVTLAALSGTWEVTGKSGFRLSKPTRASDYGYADMMAMPVKPGKTYAVKARVAADVATSSGFYLRISYDTGLPDSQGYLTTWAGQTDLIANGAMVAGFVNLSYQWTCPAGVTWAALQFWNWANGPTNLYFTDVVFEEVVEAVSILDGGIVASKLAANSVTANAIQAGAITAAKINVTDLSSISANIGTITAGTIQNAGGTHVYTVSTGVRRSIIGSYRFMDGPGFGASSNLMMWMGLNSVSLGSETVANSLWAMANDGKVYYGNVEVNSGGGSAPTTARRIVPATYPSSNAYVQLGDAMTILANSSGIISVEWDLSISNYATAATITVGLQPQVFNGGAWQNIGSEVTMGVGSSATETWSSNAVVGGLSGVASYQVRLLGRKLITLQDGNLMITGSIGAY